MSLHCFLRQEDRENTGLLISANALSNANGYDV